MGIRHAEYGVRVSCVGHPRGMRITASFNSSCMVNCRTLMMSAVANNQRMFALLATGNLNSPLSSTLRVVLGITPRRLASNKS